MAGRIKCGSHDRVIQSPWQTRPGPIVEKDKNNAQDIQRDQQKGCEKYILAAKKINEAVKRHVNIHITTFTYSASPFPTRMPIRGACQPIPTYLTALAAMTCVG